MHRSTRSAEGIRNNGSVDGTICVSKWPHPRTIGPTGRARPQRSMRFRPHLISGELRCSDETPGRSAKSSCAMRFIADVARAARWMRVWQALDYFAGVHPRSIARGEGFLAKPHRRASRSGNCRRHGGATAPRPGHGHDAKLLVLDEPTLGLDILYRKHSTIRC